MQCPQPNITFVSYFNKDRYKVACTYPDGNPGLGLAPAPEPGFADPSFPPGTLCGLVWYVLW